MILDSMDNAHQYLAMHPGFADSFDVLRRPDLAGLAAGRHGIEGERLYAMVVKGRGVGKAQAKLEAHRRYIDIQFALTGSDLCGWAPTALCTKVRQAYDAKGDCELFDDQSLAWVALPPGHFVIFFPWDGHAPMAGDGELHKVVIKVAVAWDQP